VTQEALVSDRWHGTLLDIVQAERDSPAHTSQNYWETWNQEVTNQQEVLSYKKNETSSQQIKTRGNKKRNKKTTSKREENNQNSRGRRGANEATT